MNSEYKPNVLLAILLASICISSSVSSKENSKSYCATRSGLRPKEIESVRLRNDGCTIDCLTKAAFVFSYHQADDEECHDSGYKCKMGQCVNGTQEPDTSDLYAIDLRINTAVVPDMDQIPTTGDSDPFVIVEYLGGSGQTNYKENEPICFTHVVLDNNSPTWNFACKPLPMKLDDMIRFAVYDSDKPRSDQDLIGNHETYLKDIVNMGPIKLNLRGNVRLTELHFLEVEVNGKPYRNGRELGLSGFGFN